MWVGIWPTMWGRHDVSPIWLNLSRANNYNNNSNLLTASDVQELMAKVADRLGCRAYRTADGWAVPLLPPLGAEQPDVIESLTRDLRTAIDIVGTAR
ncbi:MAG: hypothetical protein IRY92_04240 [Dactylosporangium sp.]|nr:hypothetical protein [Dactylosporangium sp.]